MSDSADRGTHPEGQRPDDGRPRDTRPNDRRPSGSGAGARRPQQGGPQSDRPQSDRPQSERPQGDRSRGERPQGDRSRGERPQGDKPRGARPRGERPQGDRPRGDRPERGGTGEKRLWTSGGKPARGDRDARQPEPVEDRDPFGIRSVRPRHDAPPIAEDVDPKELDRVARNELKTLDKENADGVALHLIMAARLIDSDPALAHQHAISAARRAGRIGIVRETLAITAYATGDYALALRELRTYRRITGRDDQLPMMVDCERGIGRPDKALELGRSVPRSSLPVPVQVELAIAMSGARLDLGQTDAALVELQIPQLDPAKAFSYSPALFAAYATVLEDLGRDAEAEEWLTRADEALEALEEAEGSEEEESIEVVEEEIVGGDGAAPPESDDDVDD